MTGGEALMLAGLASLVGGGIGARQSGAAPWKGGLVVLLGAIVGAVLLVVTVGSFLVAGIGMFIAIGFAGNMVGLAARQNGIVLIGALLFGVVTLVVLKT